MKTFQPKIILQYVYKNEIYEDCPKQELKDNTDVYINSFYIMKEYYDKYNKNIGLKELIIEYKNEIKDFKDNDIKILDKFYNFEEIDNMDQQWLNDKIGVLIEENKIKEDLMNDIEKARDPEKLRKEALERLNIGDEYEEEIIDKMLELPTISDDIYKRMPKFINRMTKTFKMKRERDVFLTSLFSVLSSQFNNVYTLYNKKRIYSNLYTFITAPPASGKGAMDNTRQLLNMIDEEYKKDEIFSDDEENDFVRRYTTIPGNSSHAAMIDQLDNQNGEGLIFQSEADTMVSATKQEWGNYSEDLRGAFEHEPITLNRKRSKDNKNPRIDISNPKISVCLSGTPDQVSSLIKSTDNGLFSRFLYYAFKSPIKVKMDLFDEVDGNNEFGYKYSRKLLEIKKHYDLKEKRFKLTKEQQDKFIEFLEKTTEERTSFYGDGVKDINFRDGVRLLRIFMILSLIKKHENIDVFSDDDDDYIYGDDDMLDLSIDLMNIYIIHGNFVFNNLIKNGDKEYRIKDILDIYNEMPVKFKNQDFIKRAEKFGISKATVNRLMKRLIEKGKLEKQGH